MIGTFLNSLFGCNHKRTSFPITPAKKSGFANGAGKGTYIVCLDCGKEFDYDWQGMRVGAAVPPSAFVPVASTAETLSAVNR